MPPLQVGLHPSLPSPAVCVLDRLSIGTELMLFKAFGERQQAISQACQRPPNIPQHLLFTQHLQRLRGLCAVTTEDTADTSFRHIMFISHAARGHNVQVTCSRFGGSSESWTGCGGRRTLNNYRTHCVESKQ
ncbi:hypothetical protein SKAU_G00243640 [Synaphobranchus kaupii]|uniref:Uncharacterized protein n=1 Tax=Synaphobranchus kaupii TaxID=118154 RepID=A0A9Q1F867_SYNKA|nr:hypothetical protein SKAU_G00243640 [Synaphobranchus kaupii]